MRPLSIPKNISRFIDIEAGKLELARQASIAYKSNSSTTPEVSIVIPAYNEEDSIVSTLSSLCMNKVNRSFEIIVVNNNSVDKTEELSAACGVTVIQEKKQGITNARNTGLTLAKGKYILNADSDTIYPENWIELMVKPLIENQKVAITYGRFALIPSENANRFFYFFYEYAAELSRLYNKKFYDEAVNVYGFNSGFRKQQAIDVDKFNHPEGTNEDGFLAKKLREKGFGKLHCVTEDKAMVWTSDRRIQIDGGIIKGSKKRIKRIFGIG